MLDKAMLIDVSRCIGCNACTVACKQENGLESGNKRIKLWRKEQMTNEMAIYYYPQACRHCYEPQCQIACPEGAIERIDGIVFQDENKCMGCQVCITVCAYHGAKIMSNGKVGKCSLCTHRLKEGMEPACASTCPSQARVFDSREEVIKEGKQRLASLKSTGKKFYLDGIENEQASVIYLLPRKY